MELPTTQETHVYRFYFSLGISHNSDFT